MDAQIDAPASPVASPIPPPISTTPRLIVRPLHPQDAPSMALYANNLNITKYMSLAFPSPYTLDAANVWISMNRAAPIFNWAICLRNDPGTVIGGCGLKPGVDVQSHAAEVGYWIGEACWGTGLATEMLAGLVRWCFTSEESLLAGTGGGRRWTRLFAGVFEGNQGSMRCLEKCGFEAEGVWKGGVQKNGELFDLHIFGLLKENWEKRN